MNKFGVFNLINSLLSVYKNQKNEENPVSDTENKDPFPQKTAAAHNLKGQNDTLGDRILKTSVSHDEFVKRVKKAQEKTP